MKKYVQKCRPWLAKLLIGAIAAPLVLISSTTVAAETGEYIANLTVTPSTFDPNEESTEISFDLLEDAEITVYVMNSDFERKATFAEDEEMTAGSKSYTWYGTEVNDPANPSLELGQYTVFVFAAKNTFIKDSAEYTAEIAFPVPSTYTIDATDLTDIVVDEAQNNDITIVNEEPPGDFGYDNVKVKLTVDSAPGEFDLMIESPDDGTLYDLEEDLYYGPTVGFVMDAEYSSTISVAATFYTAGDYTITLDLIDMDNGEAVLATTTETYSVTAPPPVPSTYTVDITSLEDTYTEVDYDLDMAIANEEPPGDLGYDHVKLKVTVDEAAGEFELMAQSADDGTLYDLTEDGYWGPTGGFAMEATYSNTIPVTATFHDAGSYTITLDLVDLDDGEAVIATTTTSYIPDIAEVTPPTQSTYTINASDLSDVLIDNAQNIDITLVNEEPPGDVGYNNVKVKLTIESSAGEFDLMVESPDDDETLYDLVDGLYYGPTVGFLMDAEYGNTIPVTATFYTAGDYTITLDLIDMDNEEAVVATTTKTYTAAVVEETPPPPPSGGGGGGVLPRPQDANPETPKEATKGESILLQASTGITDPFCDTDNHWAEEFIDELRLMGVVSGRGECEFEPDSPLNRAEATKISLGVFGIGLSSETVEEKPFPDVDIDQWYAAYLATGKEYSIISGYGDGLFRPGQSITRAEALRIILESSGVSITEGELSYSDIENNAWYIKYVSTGTELGLVEGYSDGTFRPYQSITRAEFAKLAVIMLEM